MVLAEKGLGNNAGEWAVEAEGHLKQRTTEGKSSKEVAERRKN